MTCLSITRGGVVRMDADCVCQMLAVTCRADVRHICLMACKQVYHGTTSTMVYLLLCGGLCCVSLLCGSLGCVSCRSILLALVCLCAEVPATVLLTVPALRWLHNTCKSGNGIPVVGAALGAETAAPSAPGLTMTGLRATVCKTFTSQRMLLIADSPGRCLRCHSRLTTARLRLTPWATGTFAGVLTSCASCTLITSAHAHAWMLTPMHIMLDLWSGNTLHLRCWHGFVLLVGAALAVLCILVGVASLHADAGCLFACARGMHAPCSSHATHNKSA